MFALTLFYIFVGIVLVWISANKLERYSVLSATKLGISPFLIGSTIIAFGTSAPEMLTSFFASLEGKLTMVVGNVIGSNVANIGLVLGVTALLYPINFAFAKIRLDTYFLIGITLLYILLIYSGQLVIWHALLFLILLSCYCWYLIVKDHDFDENQHGVILHAGLSITLRIIFGIAGLGIGAHFFVLGAKGIAIALGVSSLVIGMSIVALGTSLPELAASIAAAKHGETGFVIGNIIGSNIMNIVAVLGITMLINPISVELSDMFIQGIFMVILTMRLFFLLKFKEGVSKFNAGVFIFIYLLFLYFNFQPGIGISL